MSRPYTLPAEVVITEHQATVYATRMVAALQQQVEGLVAERDAVRDEQAAALLTLRRVKLVLHRARTCRPGSELERIRTAALKAEDAVDQFLARCVLAMEAGDESA